MTLNQLFDEAMGDRKIREFAAACGVKVSDFSFRYRLNESLTNEPRPEVRLLTKIAKASEGRVSVEELMLSAGYFSDEKTEGAHIW